MWKTKLQGWRYGTYSTKALGLYRQGQRSEGTVHHIFSKFWRLFLQKGNKYLQAIRIKYNSFELNWITFHRSLEIKTQKLLLHKQILFHSEHVTTQAIVRWEMYKWCQIKRYCEWNNKSICVMATYQFHRKQDATLQDHISFIGLSQACRTCHDTNTVFFFQYKHK
jgi:hypothetical protein